MRYAIGTHELLDIEPLPEPPKARVEVVERPGIDGSGFWDTGTRGEKQTIRSRADYEDLAAAIDAFDQYTELSAGDPVEIVYADINLGPYQVLNVRAVELCTLAASSGGLNYPSGALLAAEWEIIALPEPPTAEE